MGQLKARKMFVAKHGKIPGDSCCKEVRELSSLVAAVYEKMFDMAGHCFASACHERYGQNYMDVAVCRHRYRDLMARARVLYSQYEETMRRIPKESDE